MGIFMKAYQGANLSPLARALLRLVQGLVFTAIMAALPTLAPLLAGQPVNWQSVLQVALGALGVAAGLAVHKFMAAQGDQPLSNTSADTASVEAATPTVQLGASGPVVPIK